MLQHLRPRSVYDVMAAIACFGVLAGGTAYATNTIGSADIINESILSVDIKNAEVKNSDIASSSITSTKIYDGSVLNSEIGPNAVSSDKVLTNTLVGADINEASLGRVPSAASAPISGYEVVGSGNFDNPARAQSWGHVDCPAGKTATGGGVYGYVNLGQHVNATYPSFYRNGWSAYVNNTSTEDSGFRVYAVCAHVAPGAITSRVAPERARAGR